MQNIMAKEFIKNNQNTNYLDRKLIKELPIVQTPEVKPKDKDLHCFSEINRYYKINDLFSNLRYYIENDKKNDLNYVKEFMMKQGIYDDLYYTQDRIKSFLKFLFSKDFNINYSNSIQQIIKDATRDMSPYKKLIKENGDLKYYNIKNENVNVNKDNYDIFHLNNVQTKIGNNIDKKITSEFNDPKVLIENLESELSVLKRPKQIYPIKNKNVVDLGSSALQRNETVSFMKKKNKLLEFIILQKYKSNIT
jgi:hypothetical protein